MGRRHHRTVFKNAEGVRITVNGTRYEAMINEFLLQKIHAKSLVYVDKPQSIDALGAKITRVINVIPADMLGA